jgi:hypothetical protein
MIGIDKYNKIVQIVMSSSSSILDNANGRQALGLKIAGEIQMFPGRVISFVHEMEGLDFRNHDDRQTFLSFIQAGL